MSYKEEPRDRIIVGWRVYDVVRFSRFWCLICAKARWHEIAYQKAVCLSCCNQPDEIFADLTEEPLEVRADFQIERYLMEGK